MKKELTIAILTGLVLGLTSAIWLTYFRHYLYQVKPYFEATALFLPIILTQAMVVVFIKKEHSNIKMSFFGWISYLTNIMIITLFWILDENAGSANGFFFLAISLVAFGLSFSTASAILFLKRKIKRTK
jgi:hypothetical protein